MEFRPHYTGLYRRTGVLLVGLAFRDNPTATLPGVVAMAGGRHGAGRGRRFIGDHWAMAEEPAQKHAAFARLDAAGLDGGRRAGVVRRQFLFRPINHAAAEPFDNAHSLLAELPAAELEQQLQRDELRLKKLAEGMDALRADADALHAQIVVRMERNGNDGGEAEYLPDESRAIRHLFIRYMGYRKDLLHLARVYIGFKKVQGDALRDRCFLVGYGAAAVALEAGLTFVAKYRDNESARSKLNEGEPGWLEPNQFELVYHSVTDQHHLALYDTYGKHFKTHAGRWRREGVVGPDFEWVASRITRGQKAVQNTALNPVRAWFSRIGRRLEQDVHVPFYEAQKMMATFMGDTRIVRREPFIPEDLVQRTLAQTQLQPGDIILERRNWYLSNAFLPGFWPHCALYVGTPKELEAIGIEYSEWMPRRVRRINSPSTGIPV